MRAVHQNEDKLSYSKLSRAKSNIDFKAVTLRRATLEDRAFLRTVFADTRTAELAALAHDANLREQFLEMQFNIQHQNYLARYPSADNSIILFQQQPIGRMLVDREAGTFVLVDIAIVAGFRNKGIGSYLIKHLMKEAAREGKAIKLFVYRQSPALQLYQRLGFSIVAGDDVYLEMKCVPLSDSPETSRES